jgi:hypothetical protein
LTANDSTNPRYRRHHQPNHSGQESGSGFGSNPNYPNGHNHNHNNHNPNRHNNSQINPNNFPPRDFIQHDNESYTSSPPHPLHQYQENQTNKDYHHNHHSKGIHPDHELYIPECTPEFPPLNGGINWESGVGGTRGGGGERINWEGEGDDSDLDVAAIATAVGFPMFQFENHLEIPFEDPPGDPIGNPLGNPVQDPLHNPILRHLRHDSTNSLSHLQDEDPFSSVPIAPRGLVKPPVLSRSQSVRAPALRGAGRGERQDLEAVGENILGNGDAWVNIGNANVKP